MYMAVIFGLIFVYIFCYSRITSYLKERYKILWLRLGSPSLINTSISNNISMMVFIFTREDLRLNDKYLSSLVKMAKYLSVLCLMLVAAARPIGNLLISAGL
jgi:hypothetical protein